MTFKMKYNITADYIKTGTKRRSGIKMNKMQFIVAHDTGNPKSTAKNNVSYYKNSANEISASAHIFVDDKDIIECVPFLTGTPEKAWHVIYNVPKDNQLFGVDSNDAAGGIEYCYGDNINADEAYKRFVWVIAYAFYKNNVNPTKLTGHYILDPDRKSDPKSGLAKSGRTFEQLQKDVIKEYNDCISGETSKGEVPVAATPSNGIVKERIYASGGVLKRADGDYKVSATDVRYIKFKKNAFTMKAVWSKGKTVSQLVKEHGADYGFNFPFFWNGNPIADCKIGDTILNKGYDTANASQQTKWNGLAFKDGQPVIGTLNVNDDYGKDGFLVKTTPLLVSKGNLVWEYYRKQDGTASDIGKNGDTYVRCQRTFVGLDAEGNFHLAVGDGRTSYDRGLTLEEMALYMKSKGCITALNGDGGGSSVIADKTGSLGQNKGANERAVNHAILIFMNPEKTPDPTPEVPVKGDDKVEQWKLDTLKKVSTYKQKDGTPMIEYDTWKDKLNDNAPIWLVMELIERVLNNK